MRKILSIVLVISTLITIFPIFNMSVSAENFKSNNKRVLYSDTISFGNYPQALETDQNIILTLNNIAENNNWISYGYYVSGKPSDYTKYMDIELESGDKYRGVIFTNYRPHYSNHPFKDSYQDDNGFFTNIVYWFKYEPLKWRVLDFEKSLYLCDSVIDSQPFHNSVSNRHINGKVVEPNDYAYSDIRNWLNDKFYNTAFSSVERNIMGFPLIDDKDAVLSESCDRVSLLSYDDAININYHFASNEDDDDNGRICPGTSYAKIHGLYSPDGIVGGWRLRTKGYDKTHTYGIVGSSGKIWNKYATDDNAHNGIRPVIKLSVTFSQTDNDLEYPIFNEIQFESTLNVWAQSSVYSDAFKRYISEGNTYKELLYKTIDIPAVSEEGIECSVESSITVKELIAYILFAEKVKVYFDNILDEVKEKQNLSLNEAYKYFFDRIKNFYFQYFYFQEELNGKDTFNQTLNSLLLANTAIGIVDSGSMVPKYISNLYKLTMDESPTLYDDINYYIKSGRDDSFLNSYYQQILGDFGQTLKNAKSTARINGISDVINIGLDNFSYYAEKYNLPNSEIIKEMSDSYNNLSTVFDAINAFANCSLLGVSKASIEMSVTYIETVKGIYDNAKDELAGWYALSYFYFSLTNPSALDYLIDKNSGQIDPMNINKISFNYNDDIEQNLLYFAFDGGAYLKNYYPNIAMRNHLWDAGNIASKIMKMDIAQYKRLTLEYLLAEINLDNNDYGIPATINVSSNDLSLGTTSETVVCNIGSSITVTATPYNNVSFQGWKNTDTNEIVCTECHYTFEVVKETNLQAIFLQGNVTTASSPHITLNSQGVTYYCGVDPTEIIACATNDGNGTIDIKWYRSILNHNYGGKYLGSGSSIKPDTSLVGTYYYYAIATNTVISDIGINSITTNASVSSKPIKVNIINPIVTSITIHTEPVFKRYFTRKKINNSGLTLSATFSNGTNKVFDYGFSTLDCDTSSSGIKTVSVSFLNKTANYQVEIIDPNSNHLTQTVNILLNVADKDHLFDINQDNDINIIDLVSLKKELASLH